MRAKILVMMLLSAWLLIGNSARGADIRNDGNWWNGNSRSEKNFYVLGFVEGHSKGKSATKSDLSTAALVGKYVPKGCNKDCLLGIYMWIRAAVEDKESDKSFNATVGQYVDGLDKVYADYRNRGIFVFLAIGVVDESITGSSNEHIENRLRYFRKESSEY